VSDVNLVELDDLDLTEAVDAQVSPDVVVVVDEDVGLSEVVDAQVLPDLFDPSPEEDLAGSVDEASSLVEGVVVLLTSDVFVPPPSFQEDSPPPPPSPQAVIPEIASAQYQEDGLVRVKYVDETEAQVAEDAAHPATDHLNAWLEQGNEVAEFSPAPPTPQQVDDERDRRLQGGALITLDSGRMIAVQTRDPRDWRNITYLTQTAQTAQMVKAAASFTQLSSKVDAVAASLPAVDVDPVAEVEPLAKPSIDSIEFRDAYNIIQELSFDEMLELQAKLTVAGKQYYQAAWDLKDLTDIPMDYADDAHWPALNYPPEPPPGYV